MKSLIKDEKADSMAMLVIATSILAFGLFYVLFTYSLNIPIQEMNQMIVDGSISADTKYYYELALDMWKASPFFMVLGLIIFCYERSKGTDLSVQTYFEYMALMIILTIVSIYMVYAFGLSMDGITSNLDVTILTDLSDTWSGTHEKREILVKILYYVCMMPGVLGICLYVFHPIIKQKEITLFRRERDEEETDFSIGQF